MGAGVDVYKGQTGKVYHARRWQADFASVGFYLWLVELWGRHHHFLHGVGNLDVFVKNGDEAGLAVYLTPQNNYRICKKYENGKIYITVSKIADDFLQEIYRKEAADGRLKFRVDADRQKYRFMYSVNGDEYINAGEASAKFLTTDVADRCFTGTVIGVYTEAENETTAEAVVFSYKWFKNN